MKNGLILLLLFMLLAAPANAAQKTYQKKIKPKPAPAAVKPVQWAAKVNGDILSMSAYDRALAAGLKQMNNAVSSEVPGGEGGALNEVKKRVLEQMIEAIIFVQWAEREGIVIKDSSVKAKIATLKSSFPTVHEFHKSLAEQGITTDDLERDTRKQIIMEKLIGIREKSLAVSDEEIQAFYDKNIDLYAQKPQLRLKQVVSKNYKEIEKILHYVKSGGKFVGENTGIVEPGQLPVYDDSSVFKLKKGEISDVISGEAGYYIFRVEEKTGGKGMSLEDVKDNINKFLLKEKARNQFLMDMEEEKKNAKVIINPKLQDLFEETGAASPEGGE